MMVVVVLIVLVMEMTIIIRILGKINNSNY